MTYQNELDDRLTVYGIGDCKIELGPYTLDYRYMHHGEDNSLITAFVSIEDIVFPVYALAHSDDDSGSVLALMYYKWGDKKILDWIKEKRF